MIHYCFSVLWHESGTCVALSPSPFVQTQTMRPSALAVGVKMSSPCLVLTVSTILFESNDNLEPSASGERRPSMSSDVHQNQESKACAQASGIGNEYRQEIRQTITLRHLRVGVHHSGSAFGQPRITGGQFME